MGKNYYFCGSCTREAPNREFCRGRHGCRVKAIKQLGTDYYEEHSPNWQENIITGLQRTIDVSSVYSKIGSVSVFHLAHLLVHFTMVRYRGEYLDISKPKRSMYEKGAFNIRSKASTLLSPDNIMTHPSGWDYTTFSPEPAIAWEKRTGELKIAADGTKAWIFESAATLHTNKILSHTSSVTDTNNLLHCVTVLTVHTTRLDPL